MPVGTQGTVRTLSPADLHAVGAELVLANPYHLHVRPGDGVVERLGGVHRFMSWDRPLLTDSGGFQVFSLEGFRRVDDDGVEFQSHVDGRRRHLTPERATEIQWTLGADIAMAFDHVVPGGADETTARDALERTLGWLARCARKHAELAERWKDGRMERSFPRSNVPSVPETLWPILQGGTHLGLRQEGLRRIQELGEWTGLAIGGLSGGEPKPVMYEMLEGLEPRLPLSWPRYLMGVGFPEDLVTAGGRGVGLVDCGAAPPQRRHRSAVTPARILRAVLHALRQAGARRGLVRVPAGGGLRHHLFHDSPPAEEAAAAPRPAARLPAEGRQGAHVRRDPRRGRAPEGRRGHGEERRGPPRHRPLEHRQHPQPIHRGEAAVTIRRLHLLGSPVLRQPATPVAAVDDEVRRLVDDLFDTMRAAKGVGLAANQGGEPHALGRAHGDRK